MPVPYRSTVIFDGQKLPCISSRVTFETKSDATGMPNMGSLDTNIRCWIDFHDDEQVQYSALQSLFTAANVPTQNQIKDVTVEFWQDDNAQDALCSFKFKGWVRNLQMVNPVAPAQSQGGENVGNDGAINHMLIVDFRPAMDDQNVPNIQMSN